MTGPTQGAYGATHYESPESRALGTITLESYSKIYGDQGQFLSKLAGDVSYLGATMRKVQSGVDQANENFVQQLQDMINNIIVILSGGSGQGSGIDFGDFKYVLQMLGALFGFQSGSGIPLPLNVFEAAWHFFQTYVMHGDGFEGVIDTIVDGIIATILNVFGTVPILGEAAEQLAEILSTLRDLLDPLLAAVDAFFSVFGVSYTDSGSVTSFWSPLKDILAAFQTALDGVDLPDFASMFAKIALFTEPFVDDIIAVVNGLAAIITEIRGVIAMFTGGLAPGGFSFSTAASAIFSFLTSSLVPGLDASKITSGTFGQSVLQPFINAVSQGFGGSTGLSFSTLQTFLSGLPNAGAIADAIYQAIFGGSSTGHIATDVKNALQNIPGANIVSALLASIIPVLDASKITTGIFGSGRIPDITAAMSSGAQGIIDYIYQATHPGTTPITVVQTASGTNTASMAFTNPVTAGNSIVLMLIGFTPGSTPAYTTGAMLHPVNYNGSAIVGAIPIWDQSGIGADIVNSTSGSFDAVSSGWVIPNVGAGNTVTSTNNAAITGNGWVMYEVSGLGAHPVVNQSSFNHGNGAVGDNSGTTAAITGSPAFVVGATGDTSGSVSSPSSPWINTQPSGAGYCRVGYQIVTSTGGTYSWAPVGGGGNWGSAVAAIWAGPPTGNALSTVLTSLQNLPGVNIISAVLASVVPSLDASKITTGTFVDSFLPGLGAARDAIYQAINGGSTTGVTAAQIKTALQNIPGANIVSAVLAAIIPSLDASKITTGSFVDSFLPGLGTLRDNIAQAINGGSTTGYTAAQVKTALLNIPGANIISAVLASIIPSLDASKITTGTFVDSFLPGLGAARDAIYQAINGGSTTGVTAAQVKTSLLNIPGANIVSAVLAAIIPALDASKITTGSFATGRIPDITLAMSSAVGAIVDGIYQAINGGASTGNALTTVKTNLLNIPGANIISAVLAAIIPSLDASKITTGSFSTSRIPALAASIITSGVFGQALIPSLTSGWGGTILSSFLSGVLGTGLIPSLDGSKITSGTIAQTFLGITSLAAGIITSGIFATGLIPSLDASKLTTGTLLSALIPNLSPAKLLPQTSPAIDVVGTPGTITAGSVTTGGTITAALGADILVAVVKTTNTAITAVTVGGVGATLVPGSLISLNNVASNGSISFYRLAGGGTGSAQAVVGSFGTNISAAVMPISYTGVGSVSASVASNFGSSTAGSVARTGLAPNQIGLSAIGAAATITAHSGGVNHFAATGFAGVIEATVADSTSNFTLTSTQASAPWAGVGIILQGNGIPSIDSSIVPDITLGMSSDLTGLANGIVNAVNNTTGAVGAAVHDAEVALAQLPTAIYNAINPTHASRAAYTDAQTQLNGLNNSVNNLAISVAALNAGKSTGITISKTLQAPQMNTVSTAGAYTNMHAAAPSWWTLGTDIGSYIDVGAGGGGDGSGFGATGGGSGSSSTLTLSGTGGATLTGTAGTGGGNTGAAAGAGPGSTIFDDWTFPGGPSQATTSNGGFPPGGGGAAATGFGRYGGGAGVWSSGLGPLKPAAASTVTGTVGTGGGGGTGPGGLGGPGAAGAAYALFRKAINTTDWLARSTTFAAAAGSIQLYRMQTGGSANTGAAFTDAHQAGAIWSANPGGNGVGHLVFIRGDSAMANFVYLLVDNTGVSTTYELGCCTAGVQHTLQTGTFTGITIPSDAFAIQADTARNYTVLINGVSQFTYADSGAVSAAPASTLRFAGFGSSDASVAAKLSHGSLLDWKFIDSGTASGTAVNTDATSRTTTSTTYAALAAACAVTFNVPPSGNVRVTVSNQCSNSVASAGTFTSFALSGANTLAASDPLAISSQFGASIGDYKTGSWDLVGLTPGSTTFAEVHRVGSGTGTYLNRRISVSALP